MGILNHACQNRYPAERDWAEAAFNLRSTRPAVRTQSIFPRSFKWSARPAGEPEGGEPLDEGVKNNGPPRFRRRFVR